MTYWYLKRIKRNRVAFFDKEEVRKIMQEATPDLKPIFITFLNTGMRLGEICNLRWTDIDFKNRIESY